MRRFAIALIASIILAAGLSSCSGGTAPSPSSTPPPSSAPSVTGVAVSGAAPAIGSSSQFTATASMSNGGSQVVTNQAAWQSSNTVVASVSASGLVAAHASGETDIRATYQIVTGSTRITIAPLPPAPPPPPPSPPPPPPPSPPPGPPSPPSGSDKCSVSSPISASCGIATAVCNDNTYSCSQNRQGTCSSHGGVKCWICPGPLCNP
jgi:hypothetical protein